MINSEIDVNGFLMVQAKRQCLIKFIIILKQNDQSSVVFLNLQERDHAIELWWGWSSKVDIKWKSSFY